MLLFKSKNRCLIHLNPHQSSTVGVHHKYSPRSNSLLPRKCVDSPPFPPGFCVGSGTHNNWTGTGVQPPTPAMLVPVLAAQPRFFGAGKWCADWGDHRSLTTLMVALAYSIASSIPTRVDSDIMLSLTTTSVLSLLLVISQSLLPLLVIVGCQSLWLFSLLSLSSLAVIGNLYP